MTHAFTTHLGQRDFNTTLFANNTAVLQTLIFTAQALIVLDRAKDLGTEQTVALRFKGTVVDGLRFLHFTVRPGTNLLRRCKTNLDRVEVIVLIKLLKQIDKRIHICSVLNYVRGRCQYPTTGFPSPTR